MKEECSNEGIEKTLDERGSRYGDFTDHAEISQHLIVFLSTQNGWHRMDAVKRQALTVICDKIARIMNGDPNYADNWHDIQGYAKLVEDRLKPPSPVSHDKPPSEPS